MSAAVCIYVAGLCVFTLQGCVQAARLCRGSPVINPNSKKKKKIDIYMKYDTCLMVRIFIFQGEDFHGDNDKM